MWWVGTLRFAIIRAQASIIIGGARSRRRLGRWGGDGAFRRFVWEHCEMAWVVYSRPAFRGGEGFLNYLAGYTHRIAISRAAGARAAAYLFT